MIHHLFTIIATLQDIVAPRSPAVRTLERMSAAEMLAALPVAPSVADVSVPCSSLFTYRDSHVKDLVWEIKYRKNAAIVQKIGQLLYKRMVAQAEIDGQNEKILLIPIASSKQRRRERGFNQCEVMCEAIIKHDTTGRFSYEPRVLEKIKDTAHQADLPREKRLINLHGAYAVREPKRVCGKIVYIIDDVITTGATVSEAVAILLAAGAAQVRAFSIAH